MLLHPTIITKGPNSTHFSKGRDSDKDLHLRERIQRTAVVGWGKGDLLLSRLSMHHVELRLLLTACLLARLPTYSYFRGA